MSGARSNDWIGQTLANRYRVTERIGFGGMGVVFKATDTRLGSQRAIKVPHFLMDDDGELLDRFVHEVQALVELTHPNIIEVVDIGEHDGTSFAVMQYLPGGSLADRPQPSAPSGILEWLPEISDALDFVHSKGLAHRDVKPSNILFDSSGQAYLGDFGITKFTDESDLSMPSLTATGGMIGTPAYMAPEVLLPERFASDHGHQSPDQYALGVTTYEMLAGHLPFPGSTYGEIAVSVAIEDATPLHKQVPGLQKKVSDVVARALQKRPKDRFKNCRAFADAFVEAVTEQPRVRRDPDRLRESPPPETHVGFWEDSKPRKQQPYVPFGVELSRDDQQPPPADSFLSRDRKLSPRATNVFRWIGYTFLGVAVFCLLGICQFPWFAIRPIANVRLFLAAIFGGLISAVLGIRLAFGQKGCAATWLTFSVLVFMGAIAVIFWKGCAG